MTDKSFIQFQELLKPIQDSLDNVDKRLDKHDKSFDTINKKLEQHTENFSAINKKLDQHSEKLDQHTEALVNIEDTIKVYGDMYEINNGSARKLEKRIDTLEDKEGIVAPPELRLADL